MVVLFANVTSMNERPFGIRLRELREAHGYGVRELARLTNINHAVLSQAENGKRWVNKLPSGDDLSRLADVFGLTVDQLIGKEAILARVRPSIEELLRRIGAILLPDEHIIEIEQVVSAGKGEGILREIDMGYLAPKRHPGRRFLVRVDGNCLDPEVRAGDFVVIDPDRPAEDGDLVVAVLDGEKALVKWLDDRATVQFLLPLNGTPIRLDDHYQIVGVVEEIRRQPPRKRRR